MVNELIDKILSPLIAIYKLFLEPIVSGFLWLLERGADGLAWCQENIPFFWIWVSVILLGIILVLIKKFKLLDSFNASTYGVYK